MTELQVHQIHVKVTPYQCKPHIKVFTELTPDDCLSQLKHYLSQFDPGVRAELMDYEFEYDEERILKFIKRELKRRKK